MPPPYPDKKNRNTFVTLLVVTPIYFREKVSWIDDGGDKFGRIQQAKLTWHGEVLVLRNVSFSRNCSRTTKFSHILFYGSPGSL